MALDVFQMKLGTETVPPLYDDEAKGIVGVKMLDAVQTVVDVLTDNDGKGGWKVGFDPGLNAYTNREDGSPRGIVVSAKALLDAQPGTPMADIAAILTGFAVHEIGHTKQNFFREVQKRWPGHKLPLVLANVIEDVVLEAKTCIEYDGFADHGEGNVFRPALEWIAALTCPKDALRWDGSTGHKVNVVGQILRYRDFVSFDMTDAATRDALDYVETWAQGIVPNLTPKGCVLLIEDLLAYMKATSEPEPKGDEPGDEPGGDEPGEGKDKGEGKGKQSVPDEDEPDDTEGEGDDGDDADGDDTEGEDGDGDSDDTEGDDGDGNGGDSDDGDSDTEGDSDGDNGDGDGEADDDGDGEGNPGTDGTDTDGDTGPVDTLDRKTGGKGDTDQNGAGGSGETIAEASDDDFLDDFEPDEVGQSWDDAATDGKDSFAQRQLAHAEAEERITTRLDGGIHGKMRVIFR